MCYRDVFAHRWTRTYNTLITNKYIIMALIETAGHPGGNWLSVCCVCCNEDFLEYLPLKQNSPCFL